MGTKIKETGRVERHQAWTFDGIAGEADTHDEAIAIGIEEARKIPGENDWVAVQSVVETWTVVQTDAS